MSEDSHGALRSAARFAGALAEVGLALSPWAPAPDPVRIGDVRPQWLERAIAGSVRGARLLGVTEIGGTSGTTDRRRLALSWNDAGVEAGLPAHVFLKGTSASAKNRAMVAALSMATNEVKFYLTARSELPDVAPQVYAAHAGHGGRFLLVLEDLVAKGATPYTIADTCPLSHAEAMMDTLARVHASYWRSPRFATDLAWLTPESQRAGFPLLAFAFRRVRAKFLSDAGAYELTPGIRRILRLLNDDDMRLYRMWDEGPQTLVHGDSHFGNTFAFANGRAGLLDWQVVFRTRGTREVVYFLTGALGVDERRAHEWRLLQRYLDGLAAAGVPDPPSFEQAWEDYRFFAYDVWDSGALTLLWPGLQQQDVVQRGFAKSIALLEDLAVHEVLEKRLRDRGRYSRSS